MDIYELWSDQNYYIIKTSTYLSVFIYLFIYLRIYKCIHLF